MYFSKKDIENETKIRRLNLINSVSGIKPGNLIGTKSKKGESNLAIFSSVVHLGSSPALLGFVLRPQKEVRRHTYENILETGSFTINHIHERFIQRAHYTSAKIEKELSEFEMVGLEEEYLYDFQSPFVKESELKIGLKHVESIEIKSNDTLMVIGSIEHLIIKEDVIDERGYINFSQLGNIGISGLNTYYSLEKIAEYPYARANELPDFKDSDRANR